MKKEPETPEEKKAREAAERQAAEAARKAEEAAQKVRQDKATKKVRLAKNKQDLQKKIDEINRSQKGSTRQFTPREEGQLTDLEARVTRINEQIAAIDEELGN